MARPLRIEFPGAIYHVMSRGNARQTVFRDETDYQRLLDGLAVVVSRLGWDLLSFVLMPNHFHLLVRTPQPNLSRGMQYLTSGYANWCGRRHRRPGHTFQGRFKSELIEDESYFWTVSRYIHLNPVRCKRPLAVHPRDWPWSSYPGYDRRRRRVEWSACTRRRSWQQWPARSPAPALLHFETGSPCCRSRCDRISAEPVEDGGQADRSNRILLLRSTRVRQRVAPE